MHGCRSILILSTGSTNVFANEHDLQHGFQARQVMKVYLHWVRFPLVVCIMGKKALSLKCRTPIVDRPAAEFLGR